MAHKENSGAKQSQLNVGVQTVAFPNLLQSSEGGRGVANAFDVGRNIGTK